MVAASPIGTDVDDALALAYALRHPALDLVAVTTVSGDVAARTAIAARLLGLAGRTDVRVAAGVGGFEDLVWFGHEGDGLAPGPDAPIDPHDAATVDVVAYLHDPLTAAGDDFLTVERRPVTVAEHDGIPRTFVDPVAGHEADVVTGVDADGFVEHWLSVVTGTGASHR